MSERRSKRARITTPSKPMADFDDDHSSLDGDDDTVWYRGRRVDLSSMPPAERRRFKNRVSAAKSRDRKKEQVSRLEERLRVMESENQRLRRELEDFRALHTDCGRSGRAGESLHHGHRGVGYASSDSGSSLVSRSPMASPSRAVSSPPGPRPCAMPQGAMPQGAMPQGAMPQRAMPLRAMPLRQRDFDGMTGVSSRSVSVHDSLGDGVAAPEGMLFGEEPMTEESSARSGRIA